MVALPLFIQHLLQQVQLSGGYGHDGNQLYNCKVFDLALVARDDLCVDDLPLFFKQLVFGHLLQPLPNIHQLFMQLVYIALLRQLQQMSFVVRVEGH